MVGEIGDINFKAGAAQKSAIKKITEKSLNSLFQKNIITEAEKNLLLQQYLNGDINFGEDGLTEKEAKSFTRDIFNLIQNKLKENTSAKKYSLYVIQPGDTAEKIARKLGLEGTDAKKFSADLRKMAKEDGVYYNFGFKVGDLIRLPGNFDDKLNSLKSSGEIVSDSKSLNERYDKMQRGESINTDDQLRAAEEEKARLEEARRKETILQKQNELIDKKKSFEELNNENNKTKENALKITKELYNQIQGMSKSSNTLNMLKNINLSEIAYVILAYKEYGDKKESLAQALIKEWGIDLDDIKEHVCEKLYARSHKLEIEIEDYRNINNITELEKWINKTASSIANKDKNVIEATKNEINYLEQKLIELTNTESVVAQKVETPENDLYKKAGIDKTEERFDENGHKVTTYYYNDGKIVEESLVLRKNTQNEFVKVRKLIQAANTQNVENTEEKLYEAVNIRIELPLDANESAKSFANALIENKATLMKQLNLDNDTYNEYVKLALAIAEQETNFGDIESHGRKAKFLSAVAIADSIVSETIAKVKGSAISCGLTQIKYNDHIKDPDVKEKLEKAGITSEQDLFDPKKSAIATIILLSVFDARIKNNENYQNGIQAANGSIVEHQGWELTNNGAIRTGNTTAWINSVTQEDAILYYWNGKGRDIINGNAEPEANEYTRNIHQLVKKYNIIEDSNSRKHALKNVEDKKAIENFKSMDNNGPMGSVIFMPKMYKNKPINKSSEISLIETELAKNKSIDETSKNNLIRAIKNGFFAFGFGVTAEEISSLTQNDIELILSHIAKICSTFNQSHNINLYDGMNENEANVLVKNKNQKIIREIEQEFRKTYLESKTQIIQAHLVPAENMLSSPILTNNFDFSEVINNEVLKGFSGKVSDKGVANHQRKIDKLLAENAQNAANTLETSGMCLGGVRKALIDSGINEAQGADLQEGTPKGSIKWFERHPELFEEVKYINLGNGSARQITSSDLPSLPAGYIVVFVPDKNHSDQAGHISVTNGNGQAYSDIVDNMDWGNFHSSSNSGKGEHGTFKVYRLTNNWFIDPLTGKLTHN